MSGPGIYVASPLGFSEPGTRYLEQVLHPALLAAGFDVLDPWSAGARILAELAPGADAAIANERLGAANAELIEACAGVLAVLDGPDVDSGTAAEIGYAAALGRCVVGLRTDFRLAGDNAAAPVNLQVLHFIDRSGGRFTTSLSAAIAALRTRFLDRIDRARIFHVARRGVWAAAKATGAYRASTRDQSLDEVGFIHCSFETDLAGTLDRFYADIEPDDYSVLVIDPDKVAAPVVVEPAAGSSFPHIYGELNPDAVIATLALVATDERIDVGGAGPV